MWEFTKYPLPQAYPLRYTQLSVILPSSAPITTAEIRITVARALAAVVGDLAILRVDSFTIGSFAEWSLSLGL